MLTKEQRNQIERLAEAHAAQMVQDLAPLGDAEYYDTPEEAIAAINEAFKLYTQVLAEQLAA